MNESTNPFDLRYEPTREDVLIGRVTDSEASPTDWSELDQIARTDPAVWQRLAQAQRAHARFERAVEDEIAIAELVEIPEPPSVIASFKSRWQSWSGWAVAAAVVLAWLGARNMQLGPLQSAPQTAGLGLSLTPDAALQKYLDTGSSNGRVLHEMPLQVVESREDESGKQIIYYIRPILERAEVKELKVMRVLGDENGRESVVPGNKSDFTASGRPL